MREAETEVNALLRTLRAGSIGYELEDAGYIPSELWGQMPLVIYMRSQAWNSLLFVY